MAFSPRLTAPTRDNKFWISSSRGGYNNCIIINQSTGSTLPNCVGYAWGRFMEILRETPKLSRGDAGKWFGYTSDGYQRGTVPRLGAVICWSHYEGGKEKAGHVGIVEKINPDGSITISNSGYRKNAVYSPTDTRHWWLIENAKPPNYLTWSGYKFQGFIYNPAATGGYSDICSQFLESFANKLGFQWSSDSCASMIHSYLQSLNIPESLIPRSSNVVQFARNCYNDKRLDGKWLVGPLFGSTASMRSGDIVFFRETPLTETGPSKYWAASNCGVVWSVKRDTIYVIQVTKIQSECVLMKYSTASKLILGCYQPDWSVVGANPEEFWASKDAVTSVFGESYSNKDAAMRQVASLNSSSEPSIYSSGRYSSLSIMNYTAGLAEIINALNSPLYSQGNIIHDLSSLDSNPRIVASIFLQQGYALSLALGVCANIQAESNYRTNAVGDNGTSWGICGWHNDPGRGGNMKAYCGPGWENNLSKQVEFLIYELNTIRGYGLAEMLQEPETRQGCLNCADIFVRKFERPANIEVASIRRQQIAEELWDKVVKSFGTNSKLLINGRAKV